MTDSKLERWKQETRALFAKGIPNGWILGWDRNRLSTELCSAASPNACINATSFDYSRCNHYEIQFDTEGHKYTVLTVLVSYILDTFTLYWTVYEDGERSGRVTTQPSLSQGADIDCKIRQVLESSGFEEMPDSWYDEKLSDIELELSAPDDVTLGKCLFEDYDG